MHMAADTIHVATNTTHVATKTVHVAKKTIEPNHVAKNTIHVAKKTILQKRPQAQKHILWVWNMRNLETRFQVLKENGNTKKVITEIMCRMAVTLFQTSS